MIQRNVFRSLLASYKKAWETLDPGPLDEIFTEDATYTESPFDKRPLRGPTEIREYWSSAARFQKKVGFSHGPVFQVNRSRIWGAEWAAQYQNVRTEKSVRLKGVLFCELKSRKIKRFWEYWHFVGGKLSFRAKTAQA